MKLFEPINRQLFLMFEGYGCKIEIPADRWYKVLVSRLHKEETAAPFDDMHVLNIRRLTMLSNEVRTWSKDHQVRFKFRFKYYNTGNPMFPRMAETKLFFIFETETAAVQFKLSYL